MQLLSSRSSLALGRRCSAPRSRRTVAMAAEITRLGEREQTLAAVSTREEPPSAFRLPNACQLIADCGKRLSEATILPAGNAGIVSLAGQVSSAMAQCAVIRSHTIHCLPPIILLDGHPALTAARLQL